MRINQERSKITGLAALLVFTVFAVCILSVLLTGADVYQRIAEREEHNYDRRTAAQYITTRVRQADRSGSLSVESFGGVDVLVLREEIDGDSYETRVYCFEGYIRELFTVAGGDFTPGDGEKLLRAAGLSFQWETPVLSVEITLADGTMQSLSLYLRGERGKLP